MKYLVSLLVLGVLIAGGIFAYRLWNDLETKARYPLLDTRWQQTGGTFEGETGFTIDFGRSSFIATNGRTVIEGGYSQIGGLRPTSFSISHMGGYFSIVGNAIVIDGASFIKVEKPKEK